MISTPIRAAINTLTKTAARTYIVGPHLTDAIHTCHTLLARGFSNTISFWNAEYDAPQNIAAQYLAAIKSVGKGELPNSRVALKAPPLGYSRDLFGEIFEHAYLWDVDIHFDSLSPLATDRTFALISALKSKNSNLGCTIPGRWRRSLVDVYRAADLGLRVRVVKGQWADVDTVGVEPSKGFLDVITRLAGRVPHVAVATHDPVLVRESLLRLRDAGTPCELELLFGLPAEPAIAVAQAEGVPVRIYLPYGYAWLPYAIDHIKRNPRVAWWVLRDLWASTRLKIVQPGALHPRLPHDRTGLPPL
ncbi:MAG: hypothetical protein HY273_04705 [Gammaproteobacteria bacterium]|nr:hypothetical protein [Gammaproteobacteria bacterium]